MLTVRTLLCSALLCYAVGIVTSFMGASSPTIYCACLERVPALLGFQYHAEDRKSFSEPPRQHIFPPYFSH
jgi:hypothetical protein